MAYRKLTDHVGFITGAVNIGVIDIGEGGVVLIDSGLETRVAERILKTLEQDNLFPLAVINTHGHADHCGGNTHLQEETGLEIYASVREKPLIENPWLEPQYLFAGAEPISDLKNKFLQAEPSQVDHEIEIARDCLKIQGRELEIVPLTGHSPGQIGVGFEGVLFTADSYFSSRVLNRHPLPFLMNAKEFLETLDFLENSDYDFYLSSHGSPQQEISDIIDNNRERVLNIIDFISRSLQRQSETRDLIEQVLNNWEIETEDVQGYCLNRIMILSCLSYLREKDNFQVDASNQGLFWQQKD